MPRIATHVFPRSSFKLLDEYNVLVLGETQSGKSTLTQYMRKYADPSVVIDASALGTGFLSHTVQVNTTSITTDLPEYNVVDKKGANVNYRSFMTMPVEHDCEDALNGRKGLEMRKGVAHLKKRVNFNLIDTPGLNATGGNDESHVQKIFGTLVQTNTIHLILITVSSLGPFTQGLKDAIKTYVDIFSGFDGIIAFVNTRFDYKNFHPAYSQVSRAIDLRTQSLREIMGRTTFPHFKIDCNIYNKKPIRECITLNTIQKILQLATFNRPVDMLHTVVNKTRKMHDVDNILWAEVKAVIDKFELDQHLEDRDEGELLAETLRCMSWIHGLDTRLKALDEFFVRRNVKLPEVLYEERLDMEYEAVGQAQNLTIRYQETGLDIPIYSRHLLYHEIQVIKELGRGRCEAPRKFWQADFRSMSSFHWPFHVKIYTSRCKKYRAEIEEKRKEYWELQCKRHRAIRYRERVHLEKWPPEIEMVIDDHAKNVRILGFLANDFLLPEVFKALMDSEVYIGDTAQCLKKARKVYMDLAKWKRV
ncbi:hypothetical protein CPC16_001530 [Podila verticillata]|nr:hypothetical protein CPC16_001530 [Podila verticillata]